MALIQFAGFFYLEILFYQNIIAQIEVSHDSFIKLRLISEEQAYFENNGISLQFDLQKLRK